MGNQENVHNQLVGMTKLYQFFCWCSGARLYMLKKSPTEYNKYFGIGAIVFFTGILASLTGGYAMYTVFKNYFAAALLGGFWGVLIFFLDWYIVSSLRKENQLGKELLSALPRLILSVLLAIVITKPLELRLFKNEINKEIEVLKRDSEINYQDMVFEEFDEISKLENENKLLREEIAQKQQERKQLFELLIAEAEGRSPTNIVGKGSVYREKKQEYDKVSTELETLRNQSQKIIQDNNGRISMLKESRDEKIASGFEATNKYDGFLAQIEALGSLSARNKNIYHANLFLVILFILLESSPVLVKLMSKRGPYDVLLELEEIQMTNENEHEILDMNTSLDEARLSKKMKKKIKKEARQKVMYHYYEHLIEAGKEINMTKINRWKEKETTKINNNFDEESKNISNSLKPY